MSNPNPKITKEFVETQFKRQGSEDNAPLDYRVSVRVSEEIYRAIKGHPQASGWMRRILTEAVKRELLPPAPPDESTGP
ncbi:hypothetical protein NG798_07260 [Ancylothrix sp. C2]|uniref:hypothetical protein n=1 Tax=Ancylothrix sp. D3o TaxID=2953691 RepID=UPI0021BA4695|nr:hypothetical protein [Ancylothrix sp. D3o]MCT7949580.1 hypothetical protein [Ancylothrix sp. D3o]